jgi:hypothetical protein
MAGQGRPLASFRTVAKRGLGHCLAALAAWLALGSSPLLAAEPEESLRVRIAWGGGPERVWVGRVAISEGRLSSPSPLGIEADEAGSMWIAEGPAEVGSFRGEKAAKRSPIRTSPSVLFIRQISPRTYDGLDLTVRAPLQASLFLELATSEEKDLPGWVEVRLADLVRGSQNTDLDDRGNRLIVRRSPGDELRVVLPPRPLVFTPGETFRFRLEPYLLPFDPGEKVQIGLQLQPARSSHKLWSAQYAFLPAEQADLTLEVPMGKEEGVYDVVITASGSRRRWAPSIRGAPTVERTIQMLVLAPNVSPRGKEERPEVVVEIDPANQWWTKFARLSHLPRLQRLWKGPLGNDSLHPFKHPLGDLVQLDPNNPGAEVSWEAYTLPIERPGEPHILEVDYPSNVPQTFGISVVEPNAAGAVVPVGVDSGVDQGEEIPGIAATPQWRRHRLIFWPRTKTPVVILTNRREQGPAVYGKIRVLAGWRHLPRAFPASTAGPERLFAAYLDRPLFPENFSATEALGAPGDLSADDWQTFFEGGTRLVEYLHHVGYNGLFLSVLADGSTIYPSEAVQPTPRYDTGSFFATGQDPVRKDVLEMLLRMFDREGLQLVPSVEFATPMADLEEAVRQGGVPAVGMQWVDAAGRAWTEVQTPQRGRAPYYNPLHPAVQEKMLDVVREIAQRYASHPSFGGLALQLSPYGYAQLPGPEWGLDDVTIALFEFDTKTRLRGEGPNRFAQRMEQLTQIAPDGRLEWRREWLEWRAARLARVYRRLQQELALHRPGAKLYLLGTESLAAGPMAAQLRPSLTRRMTLNEALLQVGLDARLYPNDLVFLRPERIVPQASLARRAVDLEIAQLDGFDRSFQGLPTPGSLFYHEPQEVRLASFDAKSPFQPCYAWLASQPVPSAVQNRRRFVQSIAALDSQVIVDGGWLLSMGQEESLRDLIAVYRQLPPMKLEKVTDASDPSSGQPVTIRYAAQGKQTFACLVNDAPFPARVYVRVEAPEGCRLDPLSGSPSPGSLRPEGESMLWDVTLRPYDLVGAVFSSSSVRLSKPRVAWPPEVREALDRQIVDLGIRAKALGDPPLLNVLTNPGFETAPARPGEIPGWTAAAPPETSIAPDKTTPRGGEKSLRLSSAGPTATATAEPFDAPATGRVSLAVWLRVADRAKQPPLRIAVEGKVGSGTFLRYAWFGQAPADQPAPKPISDEWGLFVVYFSDLPQEPCRLHLRFDLMGPGEVWLDDVQLSNLGFSRVERRELYRLIAPAQLKLQEGQVSDCLRLLEGYWPRFLATHVRVEQLPVAQRERPPAPASEPERTPGLMDRMRNLVPERLRL